jgi:hypothetical protein
LVFLGVVYSYNAPILDSKVGGFGMLRFEGRDMPIVENEVRMI